jgi:hypothetical protein
LAWQDNKGTGREEGREGGREGGRKGGRTKPYLAVLDQPGLSAELLHELPVVRNHDDAA